MIRLVGVISSVGHIKHILLTPIKPTGKKFASPTNHFKKKIENSINGQS